YELTFRLVNKGLREIWHDQVFLYHTWHPGSDGDFNYIGPHDGRHMSTTALAVRETGRVMPLVENATIRSLRKSHRLDLSVLIDPSYREAWTEEAVSRSPRFQLFKQNKAAPRLVMTLDDHNLVAYEGHYYGVPHNLGTVNLEEESVRQHPRIIRDANLEGVRAAIASHAVQRHSPEATTQPPASKPNGAAASAALSELNGIDNPANRTLMVAEPAMPKLSEPSSVPAMNGAASIAD